LLVILLIEHAKAQPQQPTADFNVSNLKSFGRRYGMMLINNMPYLKLNVGNTAGLFVLDFGSNISSVDSTGFDCGVMPQGTIGSGRTKITVNDFSLYSSGFFFWFRPAAVDLPGVKQAGIIGTDSFMDKVYTLDYLNQWLYQSDKAGFPGETYLKTTGFKAASTKGHYV
jgi:hypothetical protein